jgi:general secretion pathway protein L
MDIDGLGDIWRIFRSPRYSLLPRYDAFGELCSAPRTEFRISSHGYSLYRDSSPSRSLETQEVLDHDVRPESVSLAVRRNEEVVVSIDIDLCFVRPTLIPAMAFGKIDKILELELLRDTPFSSDDVLSGWVPNDSPSDEEKTSVSHIVIRKNKISPAIDALLNSGARPIGLFVRDRQGFGLPLAFASDGSRFQLQSMKKWLNISLASLAIMSLSAVAFASAVFVQQSATAIAVEQGIIVQQKAVSEIRRKLEAIKASSEEVSSLFRRRRELPSRLEVIVELSRLLPDDAFLNGISIQRDQLSLDGGARSPEILIALLEKSPFFKEVSFTSPVVNNPNHSRSQFSIKLKLEAHAAEAPQ